MGGGRQEEGRGSSVSAYLKLHLLWVSAIIPRCSGLRRVTTAGKQLRITIGVLHNPYYCFLLRDYFRASIASLSPIPFHAGRVFRFPISTLPCIYERKRLTNSFCKLLFT